MDDFRKELLSMDKDSAADRVNRIKEEFAQSEYGKLMYLELDDEKDRLIQALARCQKQEQCAFLAGRLQGLELARALIYTKWSKKGNGQST